MRAAVALKVPHAPELGHRQLVRGGAVLGSPLVALDTKVTADRLEAREVGERERLILEIEMGTNRLELRERDVLETPFFVVDDELLSDVDEVRSVDVEGDAAHVPTEEEGALDVLDAGEIERVMSSASL